MAQKPSRREVLLASGVTIAGLSGCTGSAQEGAPADDNGETTLDWNGQNGSEHATQNCPEEKGYWHWILTPGGQATIQDAVLHVTFDDGSTADSVEGYRPGGDQGAIHFDVYKSGGGTISSASVVFSGEAGNAVLTISGGECVPDDGNGDDNGDGDNGDDNGDGDNGDDNGDGDNGDDNGDGDNGDDNGDGDNGDDNGDGDNGDDNGDGDNGDDNGDGDNGDDNGDGDNGDDNGDGDRDEDDQTDEKNREIAVDLDSVCYKEEKKKAQFRIESYEKREVTVTWKVLGTMQTGTVSVPKHGSKTIWVNMDTDQKLGLYRDGSRIARTKVHTQVC
ncbi:hypothetical protein [Natrinema halophilum]|uniref:Uncharacterized protein n=1 Tax=Natrinema halophilum TaxID=1699371 RepID=A0A7D5GJG1_9EURY|nr:hypothetical protein [Natrinema halophilum]QLG50628.1 hypothetical protein HYG82_18195 [Natrinema halophilum]